MTLLVCFLFSIFCSTLFFSAILVPPQTKVVLFKNHETAKAWLKAENEVVLGRNNTSKSKFNRMKQQVFHYFFFATLQKPFILPISLFKEFCLSSIMEQ